MSKFRLEVNATITAETYAVAFRKFAEIFRELSEGYEPDDLIPGSKILLELEILPDPNRAVGKIFDIIEERGNNLREELK